MVRIKCIFINVNSLISIQKRHFFNVFLKNHNPDVVLVAEHRLSQKHRINFSGYTFIRQVCKAKSNKLKGGTATAICIRESFKYERINVGCTENLENIAIKLFLSGGEQISFVSLYNRPLDKLLTSDFNMILSSLNTHEIVMAGDLNARHPNWGDVCTNNNGRILNSFLLDCPVLELLPTKYPTRVSSQCSSYLDFFLVSPTVCVNYDTDSGFRGCLRTRNFESDHSAVEMNIDTNNDIIICPPTEVFNYSKINENRFNEVLSSNLENCYLPTNRVVAGSEIDQCVESLNSAFDAAINSGAIPKVTIRNRGQLNLPQNVLDFIEEKKRMRRRYFRCIDHPRKCTLKAIINNLSIIIKESIQLHEDKYWADFYGKIRMNNTTYKKVKNLCGLGYKKELPDLVVAQNDLDFHTHRAGGGSNCDNITLQNDFEKANALACAFEKVHRQNSNLGSPEFSEHVTSSIAEVYDNHEPIVRFSDELTADGESRPDASVREIYGQFTNVKEIEISIYLLNNKKSSGEDGVSNFILRKTHPFLWRFLALLFNHCYNIGYFPKLWKCAKVIAVPKAGANPAELRGYRPISLLSNLGKLFELFLNEKIKEHINESSVFKDIQFGFRQSHSTNHALTLMADFVATNLNRRCATIVVALDFEKAFDTAWIEGIIFKMYKKFKFNINLCRIIYDYLTKRTFFVSIGDENSLLRDIAAGVPQGSILGPVIYNLNLADLPDSPTPNVFALVYADDILILGSRPKMEYANDDVNFYLAQLHGYFMKWRLKINISKCESTAIKGERKELYPNARAFVPRIEINGQLIRAERQIKYLGVMIHDDFTFKTHVDYILKKAKQAFFTYARLMRRARDLNGKIKINIYKQIVRPILGYAFPVWFVISSSQMERLRTFERSILRICTGVYRQPFSGGAEFRKWFPNKCLYEKGETVRIDCFLVASAIKYLSKMQYVNNNLIKKYLEKQTEIEFPLEEKYLSINYLQILSDNDQLYVNKKLLFYHRRYKTYDLANTVYNTEQYVK